MRVLILIAFTMVFGLLISNCGPNTPHELDKLGAVEVTVKNAPFHLWVADEPAEREKGLMYVTAEQMDDLSDGRRRGMIFVFDHEQYLNFWMKNTIIPLDIAYLDAAGTVLNVHTMVPLDTTLGRYPSAAPAQFAIEVCANTFSDLGLSAGDRIEIPATVLKKVR